MKNAFWLFAFIIIFSTSCAQKKIQAKFMQDGYMAATIIDYKVDGCKFLLELNDKEKTKLSPNRLPDELKKDKQKVWVKYIIAKKQMPSTCMAGKQIELLDIQKRK
jgi:hypothetical protein